MFYLLSRYYEYEYGGLFLSHEAPSKNTNKINNNSPNKLKQKSTENTYFQVIVSRSTASSSPSYENKDLSLYQVHCSRGQSWSAVDRSTHGWTDGRTVAV